MGSAFLFIPGCFFQNDFHTSLRVFNDWITCHRALFVLMLVCFSVRFCGLLHVANKNLIFSAEESMFSVFCCFLLVYEKAIDGCSFSVFFFLKPGHVAKLSCKS